MAIKLELSTFNLNHSIVILKLDWGLWSLSQVPPEHLATLASCVMGSVGIMNVIGCDLVTILDSLKCEFLVIDSQSLRREETQALVRAMESGVEKVELRDEVILDMETLAEYSGQGVCREVKCYGDTAARSKDELMTWARSTNCCGISTATIDGEFKCLFIEF